MTPTTTPTTIKAMKKLFVVPESLWGGFYCVFSGYLGLGEGFCLVVRPPFHRWRVVLLLTKSELMILGIIEVVLTGVFLFVSG